MFIYPNEYFNKVEEITIEYLKKNKIKALILDVDNTLMNYEKRLSEKVAKWARELKGQGIKLYILSNTNQEEKVKRVANTLEIPYEYFAKKPLKSGFLKVQSKAKRKTRKYRCGRRPNIYRYNWRKSMQNVHNISRTNRYNRLLVYSMEKTNRR